MTELFCGFVLLSWCLKQLSVNMLADPLPDQPGRPKAMLRFPFLISALLLLFLGNSWAHSSYSRSGTNVFPDLYEASVEELQNGMEAGHFTSVDLVKVGCP